MDQRDEIGATGATCAISLSVVSHGQGNILADLLDDIARTDWSKGQSFEVIVTINIPEPENWIPPIPPFPLVVRRNSTPKGFGANHNAAFSGARGDFFAVVNPDIRFKDFEVSALIDALRRPGAGVSAPLVLTPGGLVEDSARRFPTIRRLLMRRLVRRSGPDYPPGAATRPVDWLAGMFLLFPAEIYRDIGGFDERYHMYLEDVEISRRLRSRGLRSIWVGSTAVVHDASRASRRNLRHLRFHLTSMLRYFFASARTSSQLREIASRRGRR